MVSDEQSKLSHEIFSGLINPEREYTIKKVKCSIRGCKHLIQPIVISIYISGKSLAFKYRLEGNYVQVIFKIIEIMDVLDLHLSPRLYINKLLFRHLSTNGKLMCREHEALLKLKI